MTNCMSTLIDKDNLIITSSKLIVEAAELSKKKCHTSTGCGRRLGRKARPRVRSSVEGQTTKTSTILICINFTNYLNVFMLNLLL